MTRYAKGNLRFGVRTTTTIIALIAGGCLFVSGTAAEPAAGEGSSETGNEDRPVQGPPGASRVDAAKVPAEAWQAETHSENETKGKTAAPAARTRSKVDDKEDLFRPDPQYEVKYDTQGQLDTYGAKSAVEPPRPLLEVGREQYTSGLYDPSSTFLGQLNPLLPGLAVYGDWRTAVAYNSNAGNDIAQVATRLNLDVDLKVTGTERLHAFFTPLQDNTQFTRYEFFGGAADGKFNFEFDPDPQTLFFEGDLGSIYAGASGQEAGFDLPFTVGLFPLFLQNGIWANDAILGGAVSLPAKNSPLLGLSNYDITVFAAFDNVDNASVIGANGVVDNRLANLYGVTTFIDAFGGYIEAGYGLVQARDQRNDILVQGIVQQEDLLEHFLTVAYSRRYGNTISNSTRVFVNFDNDRDKINGDFLEQANDGLAIISENSLITGLPSTLIPYANFFIGFGKPQPLVDGNNAGILKNVGINFETDALTGYPKLDDTAADTWGGAIGLQYLFDLDQQLVFEVATVQPLDENAIGAKLVQYGFGVRYQIPITRSWLFRADATYQINEGEVNGVENKDNFGIRTELRSKF